MAACFEVERRHGDLQPKHQRKHGTRLAAMHRFEEAAEVLLAPRCGDDRPEYWFALARALAGAGRLAEAAEAARRVPPDGFEHAEAKALQERLARLISAETPTDGPPSWGAAAGVIDDHLQLGLVERAASWLIRAACAPDLEPAAAGEIIERAEVILALAGPNLALDVLLALRPIAASAAAASRIEQTAEALVGRPGPGAAEAVAGGEGIELCCGLALAAAGAWTQAIPVLGRVAVLQGEADRARMALAEAVGREIIERTRPSFRPAAGRKIVDVFPLFDELMLLRLKLEEMADWIDHFVILESTTTFTGKPKPLHFQENREAFACFADKIVYIPVEFPRHIDTPWAREFYQRDAALPALVELCGEDDLVLVTDVDEILKREPIEGFSKQYASFEMPTYAYFFNLRQIETARFVRGAVWRAKYLQKIGLSVARLELLGWAKKERLADAGWHFTSIRETTDLPTKFRNYSHVGRGRLTPNYFEELMERIRAGEEPGLVRCDLDDSFPKALHRSRERLGAFLL